VGWYKNETGRTVHLGGKMIRPGACRPVPDGLVPGTAPPPPEPGPDPAAVVELLERSVPEVRDALGMLSDADLATLDAAEAVGRNRKGVLAAISAELLLRAGAGGE